MPPAASDAETDRRTVGDILLARGYISEAQLEHAIASQQSSGKPLGQVLVEAGAITRLELASALAEQWSDTATWLGPPAESKGQRGRSRSRVDASLAAEAREAGYAQQLQEAVVELARRVASFEPVLTDLKLRVEAGGGGGDERLLDRVEVLQDGVTMLSRRLDELTDDVEQAFAGVQEGARELAAEIDGIRTTVSELAGRPAGDPSLAQAIATLESRIDELAARPGGDPGLAETIATLAGRIDELAAGSAGLDELRAAVAELAAQPTGDPALAETIATLTGRVDELTTQAPGHASTAETAELRAALEELAAGLAERPEQASLDELRAALDGLRETTHELAERPQADPGLASRLEELTARIEALAGTDALEAVQAAVDEIAGRPARDPQLDARLDELATRLEATAADVAGRADAGGVDALHQTVLELTARIDSLPRTEDVESVRASLEQGLASQPAQDPLLEQRLDHVVGRLDALHGRVEEVAASLPSDDADPAADLRVLVRELAERPAGDPELAITVDALAARMEELSATVGALRDADRAAPEHPGLDEGLRETLEGLIADVASRADGIGQETTSAIQTWATQQTALESRLEALAAELAEAKLQAAQPATPPLPPVEAKPRGKAKAATEGDGTGVESELERLRMAVERINLHLGERERAIGDLMRSRSQEVKVEDLAKRIAELENGSAPAAAAGQPTSAPAAADGDVHRDLRGLAQRVEEAEKAAKTDREKVLTQLERLASSIDWRFRRLESGDEHAA
jgi:chromosome segregation ATPase